MERSEYTINVQSHFSAAHRLSGYQGKCEKLHGHNWTVEAEVVSHRLNNLSMVCDFKELKQKLQKVLSALEHTFLNKLPYFKKDNPTSEKVAEFIYYNLKNLVKSKDFILKKVSVWETETQQASFSEKED